MATAVVQRPLRGSRISSFWPIKTLPSLASLDSAFQLQEYISLLIRLDVHDVEAIVSVPGSKSETDKEKEAEKTAESSNETEEVQERRNEVAVDEACWIYEQLRRLALDLSFPLISKLQEECTRTSCPEMKAGEWLYLCVAHGNDGAMEQCCAIDYILHTLDSATALLNSPKAFPSRLSIPAGSHRHFSSLARRLGRIFAHAYFHHREAFEQAEVESSLYARFLALSTKFELVPDEFLVIPPVRMGNEDAPRLMGASLHEHEQGHEHEEDNQEHVSSSFDEGVEEHVREDVPEYSDNSSWPTKPSLYNPDTGVDASPRKIGRNRTDTMIFTEGYNIMDEIAKAESEHQTTDRGMGIIEAAPTSSSVDAGEAEEETAALGPAAEVAEKVPEDVSVPEIPVEKEHTLSSDIADEPIPTPAVGDTGKVAVHGLVAFPTTHAVGETEEGHIPDEPVDVPTPVPPAVPASVVVPPAVPAPPPPTISETPLPPTLPTPATDAKPEDDKPVETQAAITKEQPPQQTNQKEAEQEPVVKTAKAEQVIEHKEAKADETNA